MWLFEDLEFFQFGAATCPKSWVTISSQPAAQEKEY
jgi:hypothetical protein